MSPKIQKTIKIGTFILVSLVILFNGAFAFFVIGSGVFEYNLSLFSLQFIIILSLLVIWLAVLIFLVLKRNNNKIFNTFASFVFLYFLIGVIMYFLGGEVRDITIFQKLISMFSVATGWPLFFISTIFFN